ncbi:glycosyltransferase family 2 protein [Aulographum hederae CBS 113979]|uniref:Glycosyltransferase family 2 protein n=1 Tax=Aulographum hederae CBS 113979 TaxID=1176131 RepID=A0A6G1H5M4_9PEZI|nr:glycosyltransferase family 2 protein [Aulographum hederae CBS 113979]
MDPDTKLLFPPPTKSKDFTVTISEPLPTSKPLPPPPSKPNEALVILAKISDFIHEWTPFALVFFYFVFSTCIYMICTDAMIGIFWFVYMATNFYIAGTTVLEAFLSMEPCREAREAVCKAQEKGWKFPTPDEDLLILDVVIVAYLPNEKDIIMDRIHYALDEIVYPRDKIRINIVYNTPKSIEPLETEMQDMMLSFPHLRVIKVPNSTSKADNLNYFFTLNTGADVIAIFDCDHYPHPHNPRWAVERFIADEETDIVQGRCIVFNASDNLLTSMIAVEFDKIYAVSHPGRARMMHFGLFCGSNGYWRAEVLKRHKMDGDMLTEDIDSALRALGKGYKAVHELNCVSYELAPTTFPAFWKQRLRWAQGWTQASIRHFKLSLTRPVDHKRTATQRFGIFSMLFIREFSYYLVTQYTCLVAGFVITKFPKTPVELARLIYFQYPVSQWLFVISIICLIATLWITFRVRSEFATHRMIIVFSITYPFYLVVMATIGIFGHARQIVAYSSWNPTART